MKVLVTGSGGRLARVLLTRLLAEPGVEAVIGVDRRPSGLEDPRLTEHRLDVRDPALEALLARSDALVHLAFAVLGRRLTRRARRAINVDGTRGVFEAAARAGVGCAVFVSSVAVYGAWPDNPERIPETQRLRPNPGFGYAEDKAAVEAWLEASPATPPRVVRLRPHAILGPHAQPLLRGLLRQPFYPRVPDPEPVTQCVWEDDVAEAVIAALSRPVAGPFNLAAEPALSFRAMLAHCHARPRAIPFAVARGAVRLAAAVTPAAGEPGWVEGLRHSVAVDCRRAREQLGWSPSLDTMACIDRICSRRGGPSR